jgi:class 3 adenylate cyclase
VPTLSASQRARLPARAFAYIDSQGRRRLPIHDESHVRNALARFDQVPFETADAREAARLRLIRAARKYGILPVGFLGGQLRKERLQGALESRAKPSSALPRGTVTFLMADIEGSTSLLRALGHEYAGVLRAVRSLIRAAVRRHGGHEVDARADEHFSVFAAPADALAAALAVQRAIAAKRWPGRSAVRVRMGIHRGRTTLSDSGYVGIAVHTVARVCDAGHGGQILLSDAAYAALEGVVPGVRARRLGAYALPGLPEREPLYQVEADGLAASFPRPRMGRHGTRTR